MAVIAAILLSVVLWHSSPSHANACRPLTPSTLASGLTPTSAGGTLASGGTVSTLPPSHDNDAGRSRIPDATPDADNDSSRSTGVCEPR